jgi:membrane fusion protein (multidrug efflux system)
VIALLVVAGAAVVYNLFVVKHMPDEKDIAGSRPPQEAKGGKGGGRAVPVEIFIADYERIDDGINVSGTLLPNETVDIASETSGKIDRIFFQEGSRVKGGAVLVKVNDDDLQAQFKRAQFQATMLKEKLDRSRILLEKDAISREAFDQVETDYNVLMADIQLLKVRIDKTEIKAPFDGVIGFRQVAQGSYLQPGTLVARLVDESILKLEFSFPEHYYGVMTVGTDVAFSIQDETGFYSPDIHRARIYAIDPQTDRLHQIVARALYDNTSYRLLPGMMTKITIGRKSGNYIQIPTEAIVPLQEGMKVWVVRDGKAVSQPVETGLRKESRISVVKGLVEGDSVIITGLLQLKEGATVQIN